MGGLCLQLDELALGQFGASDTDGITFIETKGLHHPIRQMHDAFLCDELQDTCVCGCSGVSGIAQLEHPGPFEVELR